MAKKKAARKQLPQLEEFRYSSDKRKNNPPARIAAEGSVPAVPKAKYSYSPRRPPQLQFDPDGEYAALLRKAQHERLTREEAETLERALSAREPWLEWAEKREQHARGHFEVDPVALHIHERVSTQAILKTAQRQDVQKSLFADPEHEYHQAVQFYRYDIDWTNRLILGDSLQVMSSLAHRESLSGKVQMIYIDPPYGIKFASNFQPEVGRRDVTDKETDLTREPEMVKAYRDTWHLGIHSYLTYVRDRLIAARELLADSGSLFVQIGNENLHRVRMLLDEIFGWNNQIAFVTVRKTATPSGLLDDGAFYVLWYAKSPDTIKFRSLHVDKPCEEWARDTPGGSWGVEIDGVRRSLTPPEKADTSILPDGARVYCLSKLTSAGASTNPKPFLAFGRSFALKSNEHWKTGETGLTRLLNAERIECRGRAWFTKFYDDGQFKRMMNVWTDTAGKSEESVYVVQTQTEIIKPCMLMTTDPGDLVIDPTCGSGTSAYVAEQWGRRWIAIDTSRVALAIARQRLLTATFDMYRVKELVDETVSNHEKLGVDPHPGFQYKTVPHIKLKSIAQNQYLDPIFAKWEPILDAKLAACNAALGDVTQDLRERLELKLRDKQRSEGVRAATDADRRRWLLPAASRDTRGKSREKKGRKPADSQPSSPGSQPFQHWTVPFDTDPDWPPSLQTAVTEYRTAWRGKMDEVNACIAANADQEELVDQPEVVKGVVRVTGPFTVEAVQPPELSLGDAVGLFDGAPGLMEGTFTARVVEPFAETQNAVAYLDQIIRLMRVDGVRFPDNKQMQFSRLESIYSETGGSGLHAEGRWHPAGSSEADADGPAHVAIVIGPQYGPITTKQVVEAIPIAFRRGYTDLVFAGFSFDAGAYAEVENQANPKIKLHLATIRPDVNPGMEGLLKEQPGSQLFTVFGQPRVTLAGPDKHGEYTVTMEGVDIYDPVNNVVQPTRADKVSAWFLDSDYDGRTFCITQAFFPDRGAWDKLERALNGKDGLIDEDKFAAFSGTTSLPFKPGKHGRVAVKVIDPRGNEVMWVGEVSAAGDG